MKRFSVRLWLVFMLVGPTAARAQQPAVPMTAEALGDSILDLKREGRFDEAAARARELLALLEADDSTAPHQIASVEWAIKTLDVINALPESGRAEMQQVELWKDEYLDLMRQRDYDGAIVVLDRTLDVEMKYLGTDYPGVAWTMESLARANRNLRNFAVADSLLDHALSIYRRTLGEPHPEIAGTLASQARAYALMNEFDLAEESARRSLAMRIELYGPDDGSVATSLAVLGSVKLEKREMAAAEACYRRCIAIQEKVYGPESPRLTMSRHDLAMILNDQGDYRGAVELYEETLEAMRARYDDDHFYMGFIYLNVAIPLTQLGEYERVEDLLTQALAIYRAQLGDKNASVALAMMNLGDLYLIMERYDEADSLIAGALAMRRELLGPDHFDVGRSLHEYGDLRASEGRYDEGRAYLEEALDIYAQWIPSYDPRYGDALRDLAQIATDQKRYADARRLAADACAVFEQSRRRVSYEALGRATISARSSPYRLLAYDELMLDRPVEAWMAVERDCARSMLDLLETASLRQLTVEERDEERRLHARLASLEEAVTALESGESSAGVNADSLRLSLVEAQAAWSDWQQKMAEQYPFSEGSVFDLGRIQRSLAPATALIGWLDLEEVSYAYLVPGTGPIVWEPIESGPEEIYDRFRTLVTDPGADAATRDELGQRIYDYRIRPLAGHLKGIERLCVIPSGPLLGLPVEALPFEGDRTVVDVWKVSYTPSATVLTWLREQPHIATAPTLLAVGDPPFNELQAFQMIEAPSAEVASITRGDGYEEIYRGAARGDRAQIAKLPRLGGTRKEIEAITPRFSTANVYLGPDASEQTLYELVEHGDLAAFHYVHFATHAFPDNVRGEQSALILSQVDLPDALLAAAAGRRVFDGRLTMDEIMREWRLDAELVTLSACETALGEETRGEGYIGFAHAFFRAGTRSLLVSLWKVSDQATQLLMSRFYENNLERGMDKASSLQEAKVWLRKYKAPSGRAPFESPSYWAGFVLIGDPE